MQRGLLARDAALGEIAQRPMALLDGLPHDAVDRVHRRELDLLELRPGAGRLLPPGAGRRQHQDQSDGEPLRLFQSDPSSAFRGFVAAVGACVTGSATNGLIDARSEIREALAPGAHPARRPRAGDPRRSRGGRRSRVRRRFEGPLAEA